MLDRDEDMLSTGTRHPFLVKYKVIDHGQTMLILLLNHGRPWLETVFNHVKTMIPWFSRRGIVKQEIRNIVLFVDTVQ